MSGPLQLVFRRFSFLLLGHSQQLVSKVRKPAGDHRREDLIDRHLGHTSEAGRHNIFGLVTQPATLIGRNAQECPQRSPSAPRCLQNGKLTMPRSEPQRTAVKATTSAATDAGRPTEVVTGSSSLLGLPKARRPIDFAELRRQVTIQQVLELLAWHPVSRSGPQMRGPCPIHRSGGERSRSFAVNAAKNAFRCFKPTCGSQGNQLDLYALATGLPILEAAYQLCDRLGVEPSVLTSPRPFRNGP
jgi:hypothetical protein